MYAFFSLFEIHVYDLDPLKSMSPIEDVHNCDYVFICIPTPMNKDGSQDLSKVVNALSNCTVKPIYILKSTVLPGTTTMLQKKFKI